MKSKLSSFSIIVAFICLALIGLALIPLLPVRLNPSRNMPEFTVFFSMPNSSSRIVEMEVTSKLEAMLARIRGVKELSSMSDNGSGIITVRLDKHANLEATRFEASTAIRQLWPQLPKGVSYPVISMQTAGTSATAPFLTYTLNAPSSPILIQRYAERYIRPHLADVDGVYKIELNGATPMEWRLEYDSEQLRTLGVSTTDILQAISLHYNKNFLGTHEIEQNDGSMHWIRLAMVPENNGRSFDASCIIVTSAHGKLFHLDELVRVKHEEEEPQGYFRINGLNSVYLSVTAEETANQLEVGRHVRQKMERIRQSLPDGYEVHLSYDATEYIQEELSKIYMRTGLTVLILLVFIWFITRRIRYMLLIVSSLVLNIAIAVIFYYLCGLEMQLYSLAGITISLNLVIDSTIVMADHILHHRNRKAFMAVLAATLTTAGALVIIFFLNEYLRLNLQDFAAVVIINLGVSLLIALFFVPAMMEQTGIVRDKPLSGESNGTDTQQPGKRPKRNFFKRFKQRFPIRFSRFYATQICFLLRWRKSVCLLLLLTFGLPVFLLPEKIQGEGTGAAIYNRTLGSGFYREHLKPIVDKVLGGTLRLFAESTGGSNFFKRSEEVTLTANATLPNGSTLEQMNFLMRNMESFLAEFDEIKQFQTTIPNAQRGSIRIRFKKEAQHSAFPYRLKNEIIQKALKQGGGSWSVYGLEDQGFSNELHEPAGSCNILLYGYNYDELYEWAEKLKQHLLTHRRIKEVEICPEFSYWKEDYQEFSFRLDKTRMAEENMNAYELFGTVQSTFGRDMQAGMIMTDDGNEYIRLSSRQSREQDVWAMQHSPYATYGRSYKIAELATMEKGQMPQRIKKVNQQYTLSLQYEYIGSYEMSDKVLKSTIEEFGKQLPMGYRIESQQVSWDWMKRGDQPYLLLLVVIAIIFFTTSILFNSLKQPLAIIFVIPISYIGIFLTFWFFRLNFDQGGFASFILLCGITVNASIYIINEYNNLRRRRPHLSPLRTYIKAWNAKVIPILLTVLSTILGFIPFMVGGEKENFWCSLAIGTISGLVTSVIGIFFFLPLFVLKRKETNRLPKRGKKRQQ